MSIFEHINRALSVSDNTFREDATIEGQTVKVFSFDLPKTAELSGAELQKANFQFKKSELLAVGVTIKKRSKFVYFGVTFQVIDIEPGEDSDRINCTCTTSEKLTW